MYIAYFRDNLNIIKISTNELHLMCEKPYNLYYCEYSVSEFIVINIHKIIENNNINYEINKKYNEIKSVSISYEKMSMLSCFDIPYNIKYENNYKSWFSNGHIFEKYFNKSGLIDGKYMAFYDNGNIKIEGNYSNGLKNGIFTYYHDDGKIYYISKYINNLKNGEEIYYDVYGNISKIFVYP